MAAIVSGSLLVLIDTTIIALALPIVADDLDARHGVEWAITAYLLCAGISHVAAGWLADRFGPKRVFLTAIAGFCAAVVAVSLSPTLPALVVARCAQGLCAGLVMPLATALAFGLFPEGKRGTAVGLSGTVMMIGPLLAPLLSGWILDELSWRVLVLIDLPIGFAAITLGLRALPDDHERLPRRFDGLGLAMVASGLALLLVATSQADRWDVLVTVAVGGGGVAILVAFGAYARRTEEPVVDLSVFRAPAFILSLAIVATVAVSQFARTVFLPIELQAVRGLSPFRTGLALMPAAFASALVMPLSGRWTDRSGGRTPILTGLAVIVGSAVGLGLIKIDTPLWMVVGLMVVNNVGIFLCTMAVTLVGLDAVAPRLVTQAAALRSLTRQVSGALGTAVLATIITAQVGELAPTGASEGDAERAQAAYNHGFLVAAAVAAFGLLLANRLPRGRPASKVAAAIDPGPT